MIPVIRHVVERLRKEFCHVIESSESTTPALNVGLRISTSLKRRDIHTYLSVELVYIACALTPKYTIAFEFQEFILFTRGNLSNELDLVFTVETRSRQRVVDGCAACTADFQS